MNFQTFQICYERKGLRVKNIFKLAKNKGRAAIDDFELSVGLSNSITNLQPTTSFNQTPLGAKFFYLNFKILSSNSNIITSYFFKIQTFFKGTAPFLIIFLSK